MSQTGTDESGTPPKLKNNLENVSIKNQFYMISMC